MNRRYQVLFREGEDFNILDSFSDFMEAIHYTHEMPIDENQGFIVWDQRQMKPVYTGTHIL